MKIITKYNDEMIEKKLNKEHILDMVKNKKVLDKDILKASKKVIEVSENVIIMKAVEISDNMTIIVPTKKRFSKYHPSK